MADFPRWLVVDEGEAVHLTLTPADALATIGMCRALAQLPCPALPTSSTNFIPIAPGHAQS